MADPRLPSFPKLSNYNYQAWKFKMEMFLIRDDLWEVISEDKPEPVTAKWLKADAKARANIGLSIEDNQTSVIRLCTTAKDAWEALKKQHDSGSEVYLLKKLTRLELKEGGDMEQHLLDYTDLLQRIASIGDEIPKKLQVAMLLCSLPESYDALVTALEQRSDADLSVDFVISKLLAEAEKRRERSGAAASSGGKALKTDYRPKRGRGGGNTASGGVNVENRVCYHCKRPGHLKRNCRLLQNSGGEESAKKKEGNGTKKEEDPKVKKVQSALEGPVAWIVGQGEKSSWFVDSGASRHMTGNREFFKALKLTKGLTVTLADG